MFDVFCKKVPKKYPSKRLKLFVILFTPEILFWQELFVQYCFGKGSFQDNVVFFFFICSDYHEGPHVRELFVLLQLINTDIVFTIRDVITYKKRRTNDERFHSRTTNKKNRKKMQG